VAHIYKRMLTTQTLAWTLLSKLFLNTPCGFHVFEIVYMFCYYTMFLVGYILYFVVIDIFSTLQGSNI